MTKSRIKLRNNFLTIAKKSIEIYTLERISKALNELDCSYYDMEQIAAIRERLISKQSRLYIKLQELCGKNICDEKYRNLFAATAIAGYLNSCICSELEGEYGAYAKYDKDLADGLLVTTIEEANENIFKIRHTQYYLFNLLFDANVYIDKELDLYKKEVKLYDVLPINYHP